MIKGVIIMIKGFLSSKRKVSLPEDKSSTLISYRDLRFAIWDIN